MLQIYDKKIEESKTFEGRNFSLEVDRAGIEVLKNLIREAENVLDSSDDIKYSLHENGDSELKERVLVGLHENKANRYFLLLKRK